MTVRRYDAIPFEAGTRLPTGGIRVPAALQRVGVQVYLQPDGTPRREYRPPEAVFAPEVLDAIRGLTLVREHPPAGVVTSTTWQSLAIGHVGDDVRRADDGTHVEATVYVQDAAAIQDVETGVRRQLSLGYDVVYDPTPGVTPDGQAYDGVQRRIMPNHVALTRRGRAGASVSLRLDSEGHEVLCYPQPVTKITIGGKEYEAGSPAAEAAIRALETSAARADSLTPLVERFRKDRLASLRATARAHGVEPRADAEEGGIMAETIKKIVPGLEVDGRSPEWIEGAFSAAIAMALGIEDEDEGEEDPAEDPAAAPAPSPAPAPRADSAPVSRKGASTVRGAIHGRRQDQARADSADAAQAAGLPPDEMARERMVRQGENFYRGAIVAPVSDKN